MRQRHILNNSYYFTHKFNCFGFFVGMFKSSVQKLSGESRVGTDVAAMRWQGGSNSDDSDQNYYTTSESVFVTLLASNIAQKI